MVDRVALVGELVTANRILANENVVDGFGHISVRDPDDPERYLISVSRSPERVVEGDIVTLTLDGDPVEPEERSLYLERFIHGEIYRARPDVMCVIHNHSLSVIPFSVTGEPLRPLVHMASGIGPDIPVWDIADRFGDTDMLVTNREQGADLATALEDNSVALMRGHGCVVVGPEMRQTVMKAIYLQVNATLVLQARQLGEIKYLSPGEIERSWAANSGPNPQARAWDYWAARAGRG